MKNQHNAKMIGRAGMESIKPIKDLVKSLLSHSAGTGMWHVGIKLENAEFSADLLEYKKNAASKLKGKCGGNVFHFLYMPIRIFLFICVRHFKFEFRLLSFFFSSEIVSKYNIKRFVRITKKILQKPKKNC